MLAYFITHPEVLVEPAVPITQWSLSPDGRRRLGWLLEQPWLPEVRRVISSTEVKAVEAASAVAARLGLDYEHSTGYSTDARLSENDRSSTGFLDPEQFERAADRFFAEPDVSFRGWETATDAQSRIVLAMRRLAEEHQPETIAVVSHGAVGALLLADLMGEPISRMLDQPGQGSWFSFDLTGWVAHHGWRRIDAIPS
jgi:broad specificity phosphatase PhoE